MSLLEAVVTPALVISMLALAFTIGSFWWLQARRGRLRVSPVTAFTAHMRLRREHAELGLRLPVVLFNTGARARVVDDLRLVVPSWGDTVLRWATFQSTIRPIGQDDPDFVTPFPVEGRAVVTRFVRFDGGPDDPTLLDPVTTPMRLEAKLDGSSRWTTLAEILIHFTHMHTPGNAIAYTNDPDPCDGESIETTRRAWRTQLMRYQSGQ